MCSLKTSEGMVHECAPLERKGLGILSEPGK